MEVIVTGSDFEKLLVYKDSIAVLIEDGILKAQSKIKGLETLVAFPIRRISGDKDFFAITLSNEVKYFRGKERDIHITTGELTVIISDGVVDMELPITRDVIADYHIPEYDHSKVFELTNITGLRSMLITMNDISKSLLDYSGSYVTVKNGIATCINCSVLLECKTSLPDMRISTSSLLNALALVSSAEKFELLNEDKFMLLISDAIIIRIVKEPLTESTTAQVIMDKYPNKTETKVTMPGMGEFLKSISQLKGTSMVTLTYNENEVGVSLRGNGYSVNSRVQGTTLIINSDILTVLSKFLYSDEYTITRGDKHVCISTRNRKLVICATSF